MFPQPPSDRALPVLSLLNALVSEVSAGFMELPACELGRGIDTALQVVGESLEFDRCVVGLFTPDRQHLELCHSWARDPAAAPRERAHRVADFPYSFGRIFAGHDLTLGSLSSAEPAALAEVQRFAAHGVQALIAMPLRLGRSIIGLISFSNNQGLRQWPRDVLTSLRLTAEIIASALDRKRQEGHLQARQELDALLARVSHDFVTAPLAALDEVMPRALSDIGRTLRFGRAALFRREPHSSWAALWHEWSAPDVAPLPPALARVDRTAVTYLPPAYHDGQSVLLDAAQVPAGTVLHSYVQRTGLRSLVLSPMLNAGQNFGTLLLHEFNARCLSESALRQLTLLGQLFASVISRFEAEQARARAFEELQLIKGRIERERDYLREEVRGQQPAGAGATFGSSPAMRGVLGAIDAVAATQAAVLIRGESGVGKELIARALHDQSPRRDGPLVKVNCASIPRELFESEFFGHARGAFSGALKDRVGRFELADRGTIFLDEVGDIPIDLQAKLLRVLQEGEYERVGEERTRRVSVRVLSATNRPLEEDIAAGRFRRDLYYRLSTFPIVVPPLRERGEDVLRLARHFLTQYARSAGRLELTLGADDERQLLGYPWPGNVRELQHVIERAVILSSGPRLRLELALPELPPAAQGSALSSLPALGTSRLSPPLQSAPVLPQPMSMIELKRIERDNLLAALQSTHWRISGSGGASELLGLKPSTLRDRMRALGIARGR
ncbi:MAG: sigma 54-interacting transcriptional regulator [Polyangia bacterium]